MKCPNNHKFTVFVRICKDSFKNTFKKTIKEKYEEKIFEKISNLDDSAKLLLYIDQCEPHFRNSNDCFI
jgi:hypothetical protein